MIKAHNVKPHCDLSGLRTRKDSRFLAKQLRNAASKNDINVKADLRDVNGWGVKFQHNDGKGVLSLNK